MTDEDIATISKAHDAFEAGTLVEEKMDRLTTELSGLFAQSHELEKTIKEKQGAIGYEM